MDTEQLHIRRLKAGSYKDFTLLYEIYGHQLYAYVFSLIKSHTQTKDIVQETFMKVWTKREQLNESLSFKSYLFAIARNQIINEFRKQVNSPVFSDYTQLGIDNLLAENTIEQKIDFDEFCNLIELLKKKLPPRKLLIFELNKEQGLSIKEIAEKLNITEQVVRNQLSATLTILRSEIGKYLILFVIFFGN